VGERLARRSFLGGTLAGLALGLVGGDVTAAADTLSGPKDVRARAVGGWPGAGPHAVSVHWRVDTACRMIALSFDDGPDPRWTPRVIDLLGEHGARATFFVCGAAARRHPDLVRAATAVGEVGNHSFTHPDLARLPLARVAAEVARTDSILADILDAPPTLFRPPYGNVSGPVLSTAAHYGYRIVLWTDHIRDADTSVSQDVDRIITAAAPGRIVLGHDGRANRSGDLARLPGLLRGLTAQAYTLVSFSELLTTERG
jgi:peptidoglycan/xylan/chitin deacetylase (PgdA/CDA1 family)